MYQCIIFYLVFTKTRSNLQRPGTTHNEQEKTWSNLQRPETTYNEQETTWNNLQRAVSYLKWPTMSKIQSTTIWTYQQQAKED